MNPLGTIWLHPCDPLKSWANDEMTACGVLPPLPITRLFAAGATVADAVPESPMRSPTVATATAATEEPRRDVRWCNMDLPFLDWWWGVSRWLPVRASPETIL